MLFYVLLIANHQETITGPPTFGDVNCELWAQVCNALIIKCLTGLSPDDFNGHK